MTENQFYALFTIGLAAMLGMPYGIPTAMFAFWYVLKVFKDHS